MKRLREIMENFLIAALDLNAVLWIMSPWGYWFLRSQGVINHPHDSYIIIFLAVCGTFAALLTFGRREK